MIIAVDFDGTCVTHEFPRVGAAEVLKELTDKGHKIILFTMRSHQLDGVKDRLFCKNWIFIDDSYYLGRTKAGISVALRKIRPDASLYETYVIYDGSMGRADKVKSMYRYGK